MFLHLSTWFQFQPFPNWVLQHPKWNPLRYLVNFFCSHICWFQLFHFSTTWSFFVMSSSVKLGPGWNGFSCFSFCVQVAGMTKISLSKLRCLKMSQDVIPPWSLTEPLKSYLPNRKVVFQAPFFRGFVKLQGCKTCWFLEIQSLKYQPPEIKREGRKAMPLESWSQMFNP